MGGFKIEISCDDGSKTDMLAAEMLSAAGLPATFYVPTCRELSEKQIKYLAKHFELGGHTVTHFDLTMVSDDGLLAAEISENKAWLEGLAGRRLTRFCYPNGNYDDRIVEAVRLAGYEYARTTRGMSIEHPKDLLRVRPTIHVLPGKEEYAGRPWPDVGREMFFKARKAGGCFHLWMHGWEVHKHRQWGQLREFLGFMVREIKK